MRLRQHSTFFLRWLTERRSLARDEPYSTRLDDAEDEARDEECEEENGIDQEE
jgi:hypothetical protein